MAPESYRQLAEMFPDCATIAGKATLGSNERYDLPTYEALHCDALHAAWKEFLQAHANAQFVQNVCQSFGKALQQLHPSFETTHRPFEELSIGIKHYAERKDVDIIFDFNIGVNTPVREVATRVRQVHIDKPEKLFAGLFYLRSEDDHSTGGELAFYRYKNGPPRLRMTNAFDEDVEEVKRVPYAPNTLVIFMNSPHSLHGVTPRSPTESPRRFIYFSATLAKPLFEIESLQLGRAAYLRRRLFPMGVAIPTVKGFSNSY